jgi:two-component system cell cycle response regulator DivK
VKKILVAEDDQPSRELIREILETRGYSVIEACDGGEALQKIQESAPNLVLLDLQIPVMDGFAVLSQLRQDPRFATLRVAALTAYAMRGDREKALRAGFDAYITKPIDATALRAQIEQLLS